MRYREKNSQQLRYPHPCGTDKGAVSTETHEVLERHFIECFNKAGITDETVVLFREVVWAYYKGHKRVLPWRETNDPYKILVSEIMLQQTQVPRVLDKYREFVAAFPDFASLAVASLRDVLQVWQGLGYNRRAIALKTTAQIIVDAFSGSLPTDTEALKRLPGIGPATAAAICAFAFNRPAPLIETNIRAIFIHFFFKDNDNVKDSELLPLVERTLDRTNPREWYYALMDYGVILKKIHKNPSRRSAHHKAQSPFKGSHRALRAAALRVVLARGSARLENAASELKIPADRAQKVLDELEKEGFITRHGLLYES
jgi:A/G-specific adenine glycosylase